MPTFTVKFTVSIEDSRLINHEVETCIRAWALGVLNSELPLLETMLHLNAEIEEELNIEQVDDEIVVTD